MVSKAEAKYIRMSARKARLVIDLVKGKSVEKANFILDNTNKKACFPIKKVLGSAFANANNNRQDKFLEKDLNISLIRVDDGPMLRRFRAATMGRATSIKHRTAHVYVELKEKEKKASKVKAVKKEKGNKKVTKNHKPKPKTRKNQG